MSTTDFFVDQGWIKLDLSADGKIAVHSQRFRSFVIDTLEELSAAMSDPARWTVEKQFIGDEPRGTVLKGSPEGDLYTVWSSVVDDAIIIGTREELLAEGVSPARLARAERYGSSAFPDEYNPSRAHGWDTENLIVQGSGELSGKYCLLPRELLGEYLRIRITEDAEGLKKLLEERMIGPDEENE